MLLRQAARRFGADTAEALAGLLEGVDDADRLAETGEMIVDYGTGSELLDRVKCEAVARLWSDGMSVAGWFGSKIEPPRDP